MSEEQVYNDCASVEQNECLSGIFEHINVMCFDGTLNPELVMLTFSRTSRVIGGHFNPMRWTNSEDDTVKIHEIALNANIMQLISIQEFLKILAHEMVHLWEWETGNPGRQGYHTKEWGKKMLEIGLVALDAKTGEPVLCGQSISNGPFTENSKLEAALRSLPLELQLPWSADPDPEEKEKNKGQGQGRRRGGKRAKYTCPQCGLNAWSRFDVSIICGECNISMVEELQDKE